jgi:hypothetical protein
MTTPSTTSAAVTSGVVAGTTAATIAASSARADRKCVAYMASPDLDTVFGRQAYAACVERLEPTGSDLPPREVVGSGLLLALVGAVVVVYFDRREGGFLGPVLAALFGAVVFPLLAYILLGVGFLAAYALGLTS